MKHRSLPKCWWVFYDMCSFKKIRLKKDVVTTKHATSQEYVDMNKNNKFLYLCKLLNLKMKEIDDFLSFVFNYFY